MTAIFPEASLTLLGKKFLYEMVRIRQVEERIAARYHDGEMRCPVHLSIGQEAIAVGISNALDAMDGAFSTHRCHAHYLAKGGDLKKMIAEIYGKATGCCKGKGGSMHLQDQTAGFLASAPIVGSTIPISVGAAFGNSFQVDNKRVTIAYLGDGATEEGVFHESLNFAALKKLPIIFVCENNLYSVYSQLGARQSSGLSIAGVAEAHGWKTFTGDGNDVLSVYNQAREAVEHARGGQGPVFMELFTYRWLEHCGPNYDDELGYRPEGELDLWRSRCPIDKLTTKLVACGEVTDELIAEFRAKIEIEIEDAFEFAKSSPFPEMNELFTEIFANEK